jgi:hypothetical protein
MLIDGQTCVPCRHWHGHGRVVPRLSTTLPCWRAYRVVPRRAGVPASQPRHYTKEAGACRVVLLGTTAQQCPCQPRHDASAQVQTKHRFTKCSNTKIHSFKVTTHKENARLYIGGEGRPGSTITREGQPGSNSYRTCPVPAAGAGRARVVFACWDSSPTLARGRAVPGTDTGQTVPCPSRAVFKRAVFVPAQRAEPIWTSIPMLSLWSPVNNLGGFEQPHF